jgi:ABC-type lipoprotein release transport system permease subunit
VELAEDLDIRVGERVVVLATGGGGSDSRAFTAVGLFRSTVIEMERVAMITIDDARTMLDLSGATALAVGLPRGTSAGHAAAQAERMLGDQPALEVADYFALNPLARVMISGATIKLIPFVIMISLMAGFGVANTAFYSVLERTREFGVMTAVGMSRKLLAGVILLESILVSAIGFVVGGGVGYGLLLYLSRTGINFGPLLKDFGSGFGMPTIIYTSTSGWYWVAAFSVVVFTAVAAAWYPARRVNRLEPVPAIREG